MPAGLGSVAGWLFEVLKLAKDQASRVSMQQAGLEWHKRNSGSSQRIAEQILKNL